MVKFIANHSVFFLLLATLMVVKTNPVSSRDCVLSLDWNYNPLLKQRASVQLEDLIEVENCFQEKDSFHPYEKFLLYQTFYQTRNQDSCLHYANKLIDAAIENSLGKNKLAYAYWIKARVLFEYADKLQPQTYLLAAKNIALDPLLIAYIQIDLRYTSGIKFIKSNFTQDVEGIELSPLDYYSLSYLEYKRTGRQFTASIIDIYRILKIEDDYFKFFFFINAFEELHPQLEKEQVKAFNFLCNTLFDRIDQKDFLIQHRHYTYSSLRLSDEKKYKSALEQSSQLLRFHQLNSEKLDPIGSSFMSQYLLEAYLVYARSLLFMTREGMGLEPVKKAYRIYIHIISEQKRKTDGLFCLNRSNYAFLRDYRLLDNILVIAKYLTQKTGDLSYLTGAYSALDELKSAAVRSGIRRHRWINEGGKFADLLLADNELSREIYRAFSKYVQSEQAEDYFGVLQSLFAQRALLEKELQPYIEEAMAEEPETEITKSVQMIQQEQLTDSTGILLISSAIHHHSLLILKDTILTSNLLTRLPSLEDYTSFTRSLSDPSTDYQTLTKKSRLLYTALFGEYEGFLPPYLSIIANGPFETYPFAALRSDTSGSARYFGQDHVLNYHYSLRTFLHDQGNGSSSASHKLLAMAPSFDQQLQYSARRTVGGEMTDYHLRPLHYNQAEVQALSASFPGQFLTAKEATIDNFNDLAAEYSIIHLATHAVANVSFGSQGGFFLERFTEDPNDALITAGQVTTYHLNSDLVSLSACESGLGSIVFTEGTVGLTRSFSTAGAKSVLSTLWTVDDQSTAEIVTDFYKFLKQGSTKAVALSQAQADFRERHAGTARENPYYWAAFVLVGNNDSINWLAEETFNWYYLIIAVILIALGFLYVQSKRQSHAT